MKPESTVVPPGCVTKALAVFTVVVGRTLFLVTIHRLTGGLDR